MPKNKKRFRIYVDFEVGLKELDVDEPKSTNLNQNEQEYLDSSNTSTSNTSKPSNPDIGFLKFWHWYPKKRKKGDALKAWKVIKPNPVLVDKMITSLRQQIHSDEWRKDGGQFIPLPASWLRGVCWEDEPYVPPSQVPKTPVLPGPPECPPTEAELAANREKVRQLFGGVFKTL